MMIVLTSAFMTAIFVIGYMIGRDIGHRKAHERLKSIADEEVPRKRQARYTSTTKKLHLVKDSSDMRE